MSQSKLPNDVFAHFFAESQSALKRYVQRFIGSRDTAEEIVQEAFLRTYEQGDSVRTPRAFLFSTARNLASNAKRDHRTSRTDSVGEIDDSRVVERQVSAEEGALAEERTQLVKDAIERLPPKCRVAFTLRIFHGCSYREIADRMGISTKTVEKYIARGLHETHQQLRRRYRDAGHV